MFAKYISQKKKKLFNVPLTFIISITMSENTNMLSEAWVMWFMCEKSEIENQYEKVELVLLDWVFFCEVLHVLESISEQSIDFSLNNASEQIYSNFETKVTADTQNSIVLIIPSDFYIFTAITPSKCLEDTNAFAQIWRVFL